MSVAVDWYGQMMGDGLKINKLYQQIITTHKDISILTLPKDTLCSLRAQSTECSFTF